MRQKRRNLETEKYVAKKQINAIGGGLELEDLLKIIDAKDGDYYKAELNPREGWREAYEHFGMTGKRETLDLQKEIVEEMKQYYGLNGNTARTPTPAASATEVKEKYVNDILGYDVQKKYEDILSVSPEEALLAAAALGVGGLGGLGIGNTTGGGNEGLTEEDLMAMQEENPGLMVRYA